jgi:hypothetical protein
MPQGVSGTRLDRGDLNTGRTISSVSLAQKSGVIGAGVMWSLASRSRLFHDENPTATSLTLDRTKMEGLR